MNSPSLPHPEDSRGGKERKDSVFHTPGAQHTPLPQAPSDSPLAHIWDRDSAPALGSTAELRKAPAHPTQTHSALAPTPCPYPALLQWFFLGVKLTLCPMFPCRTEYGGKRGMPHCIQPSFSLHSFQSYMLFLLIQMEILLGEEQLHSSQKELGYRDQHPQPTVAVCPPNKGS